MQKSPLELILINLIFKLLYEWQQAVIKLFNEYYSIAFEAKHKPNKEKD